MTPQKENSSHDFKSIFLIEFTKEIIRATESYKKEFSIGAVKNHQMLVVERGVPQPKIVKIEKKDIYKIVQEKIKRESQRMTELKSERNPFESFLEKQKISAEKQKIVRPLFIPEPKLPITVQYVSPIPLSGEINLKKVNPLIQDRQVGIIECNGPDENIYVTGTMGRKKTAIILTKIGRAHV